MKSLDTYINEAQNASGLLGEFFDFNNKLTIRIHSDALDRAKLDEALKGKTLWDDHVLNVHLDGLWQGGVRNDLNGSLKELSDKYKSANCAASEIIDLIRILSGIKINNANSVRSVVGEVRKTIESLISDDISKKSLYIWSQAKNDDEYYWINFDENFGRAWRTVCTLSFKKK